MRVHTHRAEVSEFKHQISRGKKKRGLERIHPSEHCVFKSPPPHSHHTKRRTLNVQMPVSGPHIHCLDLQTQPLRQEPSALLERGPPASLWHPQVLTSLGICSAWDCEGEPALSLLFPRALSEFPTGQPPQPPLNGPVAPFCHPNGSASSDTNSWVLASACLPLTVAHCSLLCPLPYHTARVPWLPCKDRP